MNKTLSIIIIAGALVATYFIIRKKYTLTNQPVQIKDVPRQHRHHLTDAFANAKKHAVK